MRVPENNLAYPILITLENGSTGSGFFINSGKANYFITAKHVIYDEDQSLRSVSAEIRCMSPQLSDRETSTFRLDFNRQRPKYHKSADVCVFTFAKVIVEKKDVGGWGIDFDPSVEVLEKNPKGIVSVNLKMAIKKFDNIEISNNVFLYGFPTSLGLKGMNNLFDYSRPLLRKGIIANIFPEEKTIILDCPVYYGNSGGPVIEESRNKFGKYEHNLIGVVSKFIPYVQEWINNREKLNHKEIMNSGYSIASSIDFVIELINSVEQPAQGSTVSSPQSWPVKIRVKSLTLNTNYHEKNTIHRVTDCCYSQAA